MGAIPAERPREIIHGLVNARLPVSLLVAAGVAAALVGGIAGGLLRAGALQAATPAIAHAAAGHAALMIAGFFGAVIGIERAVAARQAAAWIAPAGSICGAVAVLFGWRDAAPACFVIASAAFVAINLLIFRRQRATHTFLLVAGAVSWFAGCVLFASGVAFAAVLQAWLTFLIVTVAAERLEMTRLMRRRPSAEPALLVIVLLLAIGIAASAASDAIGAAVWGAAILALSAWLLAFDIARRTIRTAGLPRYMAACLLAGYVWLAVGGVAWMGSASEAPLRDAALHAIGLGFVFSMVMGHAPVILPAIARVQLAFGPSFYAPVVLLHASLAWRIGGVFVDSRAFAQGAIGNAAAIALFALTVLSGFRVAGRYRRSPRK